MDVESHGSQKGSRLAQGACVAAEYGCPNRKAGSSSPGVKGLFGTGDRTGCGEVSDEAEAASWTPARVWLLSCGDRDVRALPICVVASAHGLVGVEVLGADVWVSSCGADAKGSFSFTEAAPTTA